MSLQFWFAVLIRKTQFGSDAFQWLADRVVEFLKYTDKGSMVVFGSSYQDHRFVFQVWSCAHYTGCCGCCLLAAWLISDDSGKIPGHDRNSILAHVNVILNLQKRCTSV